MPPAPGFLYRNGGLHFPGLGLWMDPSRPVRSGEWSVVTHAHADHTARHEAVILTEPTRRLMQARLPGRRIEQILGYNDLLRSEDLGEPAAKAPFTISLHPSGHILGSAMVRVEHEGDSVLFTGDFKLRPGLSSERCEPVTAETLVMETTYGRPRYRFPPTEGVQQDIRRFCTESLDCGMTPVLLAYSLGKTQEVLAALAGCGLPIRLHPSAASMTRIYAEFGARFPDWRPWDPDSVQGQVVITPTLRPLLAAPGGTPETLRIASISGWALDARRPGGSQADFPHSGVHRRFPLSDHADFDDLWEFVKRVNPRRVFTVHGFAADFARFLRRQGLEARALSEDDRQLDLAL